MRIVLGVGGGIAAYKACELASRLTAAGHLVYPVLTEAATGFVTPLTFEALTHQPVAVRVVDRPVGPLSHVALAHSADLVLVAPATADLLARLALGRADDMLTAVALGAACPLWVAPAMEAEMWDHPATRRHVEALKARGVRVWGPGEGRLASGLSGRGRMVEPQVLLEAVRRLAVPQDLAGRRVLVTAGPTWEFFDPVRLLTNPSSGRMGIAIAAEARDRGAQVTLVHGPVTVPLPDGVEHVPVVSAEDLLREVSARVQGMDVVVAAAAVSDFRPRRRALEKMKKDAVGGGDWDMERTPDVLASLGAMRTEGQRPFLVGFKAETSRHVERAREMLVRKHLNLVVANRVEADKGFRSGVSEAWFVRADGTAEEVRAPKEGLAERLWVEIGALLAD